MGSTDGHKILAAIYAAAAPVEVRALAAVEILRRTWVHQFYFEEGQVR